MNPDPRERLPREIFEELMEEGAEAFRNVLEKLLNLAMELERSEFLGAEPYERTSRRRDHANGFKDKTVATRVGRLKLKIPQVRTCRFTRSPWSEDAGRILPRPLFARKQPQAHAHNRAQAREMGQAIRDIFNCPSLADAEAMVGRVAQRFATENPPWVKWLEDNIGEGFTVYRFARSVAPA